MPIAGLLAAVAILVAGGATRTAARPPVSFDLNTSIPLRLGSWTALANRAVESHPLPSMPWQDEVWREYRDRNGDAVTLYVGRYLKRRESGTVPPFWTDRLDRSAVPFSLSTGTGTMNVRHIDPRTGQDPDALLWYVLGDDVTTSRLLAKANGLIYGVSHSGPGPLVVVVTAAPGTRQPEIVLRSFAAAVIPAVARRF